MEPRQASRSSAARQSARQNAHEAFALPAAGELATHDLRIVPRRLGDRAGVVGAAIMAIEHVLAPDAVDRLLKAAA